MKYFRTYPWGMQLLLFLLMSFTFLSSVGAIVLGLFTKLTGYMPADMTGIKPGSPMDLIRATVTVQGVQSLFVYCLPALAFAYLAHPRPMGYLGLRRPGKYIQVLLAILLMAGAMPILMFIEHLVRMIDFGAGVKAAQLANDNIFHAFMQMPTFSDFVRVFVVVAILPAIGEELFFRGILLRFARRRSPGMLFPILFTAVVFSYSHSNIYGYISIFMAGALLAIIYNLTGSIWCSIAGHLFFNGSQIVLSYMGNTNNAIKSFMDNDNVPYSIVIGGAVLFGVAAYMLLKNSTPLPPDWSDDYSKDELKHQQ